MQSEEGVCSGNMSFGHEVWWDGEAYRYMDGELADGWGGDPRDCPECGELPTEEGYDPCLGCIPGAKHVCCGHGGRMKRYCIMEDGSEREV